jgi:hypothetical protein
VNTNNEPRGARDGVAVRGVRDIGAGDDPTIFSKLDNKTNQDSMAVVIWMDECYKN